MKKIVLLACFVLFTTITLSAQRITLCEAMPKLLAASQDSFNSIAGTSKMVNGSLINISKIQITNAGAAFLNKPGYLINNWYVRFGSYNSKEEARAKVDSVLEGFKACSSQYELIEDTSSSNYEERGTLTYILKENLEGGFKIYKAELIIGRSSGDKFNVSMNIEGMTKGVTYYIIGTEPANTVFAEELQRFLDESKTEFAAIKGAAIAGSWREFESTACISKLDHCMIDMEILKPHWSMKAYAYVNISESDADIALNQMVNVVASALGKDYVMFMNSTGSGVGFTLPGALTDSYHSVVDVKKAPNKKTGNFDVVVAIHQWQDDK